MFFFVAGNNICKMYSNTRIVILEDPKSLPQAKIWFWFVISILNFSSIRFGKWYLKHTSKAYKNSFKCLPLQLFQYSHPLSWNRTMVLAHRCTSFQGYQSLKQIHMLMTGKDFHNGVLPCPPVQVIFTVILTDTQLEM